MNSWVLVPVKPFKKGKSRLRDCFSRQDLYALNYNLFVQTIRNIKEATCFDEVLVVSRDRHALAVAEGEGVCICTENRPSSLNQAVRQGMEFIEANGAGSVLVLPTDLPRLRPEAIISLKNEIPEQGVLIVPDHCYKGTNALGMSRPGLIQASFGNNSFHQHCLQAQEKDLSLRVYYHYAIMQDLDTKPDLHLIRQHHHFLMPITREERTFTHV
ncbi:MAG: 2-phospho-L-lactate guanylyltransferase [Anaerolineaceae bacterium]|nr:2-phospho-L-lactate guanylyltransferase [Anaerolineaceae bacterium]